MAKATVYSKNNCPFCVQLKQYLDSEGIAYEEKNIDVDPNHAEELAKLGYMSVPVTVIGETVVLGLNANRIKKAVAALSGASS